MTLPRLAELYLDELTMLLAPADPVDRIEIVAGVREHIEARLADLPDPTEADVRAVLADLGSPDALARSSLDPTNPPSTGATPSGAPPQPWPTRPWVRPLVVILVTLAVLPAVTMSLTLGLDRSQSTGPDQGTLGPLLPELGMTFFAVAFPGLIVWPIWLAGVILMWISPLWRPGLKTVATLLPLVAPILTWATVFVDGSGLTGAIIGTILTVGVLVLLAVKPKPQSAAPASLRE